MRSRRRRAAGPGPGPEESLIIICLQGCISLDVSRWIQRMQVPLSPGSPLCIRPGIWRAFHRRWPSLMRASRSSALRDLAASLDADAATSAIDNLLSSTKTPP